MRNLSIKFKIIFSIVLFTIFIVGLERYSLSKDVIEQFVESKKSKNNLLVNTISPIIGLNISLGLDGANKDYLDEIVRQNSDIEHMKIIDLNGKEIYSYSVESHYPSYKHSDSINFLSKTIVDSITGDEIAKIDLHFLNKEYQAVLDKNRETTLKIFAITFILLLIFILAIRREFRHLESLSNNVLNYDPKMNNFALTKSERKDEVGIIHNAILSMVEKIEEHSKVLDKINISLEEKVKQRTKELEYSNAEFKNMLNSTMEGVAIFEDGKCINFNQAAVDIFGYSSNENLLGSSPFEYIAPHVHELAIEKLKQEYVEPYESVGLKQDGTNFPILVKGTTYKNNDISYRISAVMDLTKIKENEKLLELAKLKAEESTKAKSNFLANMSHEIRTPMSGIIGMTHLVKKTNLNEKQMNYISTIEAASNNLLNIINDILDISKIEAGKLELENILFSLTDVIEEVIDLTQVKTNDKNIKFNLFYKESHNMFYGDPLRLSQILINLINNAIKFTHDGVIELYVEHLDNNVIKFCVKDSGIGLTEEEQNKLFKQFSQADESTTRKYGGSGLGLSISKQLVEMMDGKIWVESEINKGSEFIFEIKLLSSDDKSIVKESREHLLNKEIAKLRGSKILLAEDNITNQLVICGLLEESGIEIDIAQNGQEAVDKFLDKKYKLILMDLHMPIMDGYEATQKIRETNKEIPIIAITADAMKEDMRKCKTAGMNAHLNKPIDVEILYETLLKHMSKKSD